MNTTKNVLTGLGISIAVITIVFIIIIAVTTSTNKSSDVQFVEERLAAIQFSGSVDNKVCTKANIDIRANCFVNVNAPLANVVNDLLSAGYKPKDQSNLIFTSENQQRAYYVYVFQESNSVTQVEVSL